MSAQIDLVKYEANDAEQLVGFTIVGVCTDVSCGCWGLRLKKGTLQKVAWVDQDPEGNGPGHLSIQNG